MTAPKETLWELDPHTTAKHEILRRYLGAWFPILGANHSRIIYVDGFSGPGRYKKGEPGSPLIALEVAAKHPRISAGKISFRFIEEREDRLVHLKGELATLSLPAHFEVVAQPGRFNENFGEVLASIDADKSTLPPTFAFIDPFGFSGIPFALIQRLLSHQRSEAFITFMVDSFNRFLEHPEDKVVEHIVEAFGGDEAIQIAKGPGDRIIRLRELYQSKLHSVAKFIRFFEMRDRQDRIEYYLFFATNNELGHLKMKEAMWKVDPDGEFRFSDATNPNQRVLFEADPARILAPQIRDRFRGKGTVTARQVRIFVENETAYLKKHMTAALKQAEESGQLKVDEVKADGKKRVKGTFPDEVKLTWV